MASIGCGESLVHTQQLVGLHVTKLNTRVGQRLSYSLVLQHTHSDHFARDTDSIAFHAARPDKSCVNVGGNARVEPSMRGDGQGPH